VLLDPGVEDIGPFFVDMAGHFDGAFNARTWDRLYSLPTDPKKLARELRDGINGAGNGDDRELFVIVGDLLRESPAPPALRKALYQVAAAVPGVELVGPVTDSLGRSGVAVQLEEEGRYTFDPADGRLLEESSGSYRRTVIKQGPADAAPTARYMNMGD
jgi:hypothetical protein